MGQPMTLQQLKATFDDELVRLHDESAGRTANIGINYYLDELRHRAIARQTRTITRLTWVVTAATIVNVIATIFGR